MNKKKKASYKIHFPLTEKEQFLIDEEIKLDNLIEEYQSNLIEAKNKLRILKSIRGKEGLSNMWANRETIISSS